VDFFETLPELLAASVARHGSLRAVSDDDTVLTYAELDAQSDRLAGVLAERGVRTGENVGICLDRGVGVVVAMLGVIKAGAAYLPIDADYPTSRRELMTRDGGVRLLVTRPDWADRFSPELEQIDWQAGAAAPAAPGTYKARPADAACVLYTSGSTGEPKGIVFEHRNIAALARNPSLPKLGTDDKVGQISSISFDGITLETWAALAAGAEIVVLPKMSSLLPVDLRQELSRRKVSMMLVPATVLNEICRVDRDAFAPLQHLCSGGDVILPATCRALLDGRFKGDLYNLYGPSEITTAATAYRVQSASDGQTSIPIGTAIDGYETYVVDEQMRPVRPGEIGELLVGGIGVARGYLGLAALTAQRFLPNLFGQPGSRVYASGDRVRQNEHGQLVFLGRLDGQVKIRGHRVEPAEVEQALARHPGVTQAAVFVEELDGDRRLAAFVVPAAETLTAKDLRAFLADSVPQHMVPTSISVIRSMPVTGNGKRDLEVLAELRDREVARARRRIEPEGKTELWLATLWERLVNIENIGADDDFFELGGHSLQAFRVRTAIAKEFGVRVDSHILFEHSTLRALADVIDQARSSQGVSLS
jgi:amino acid adenylation domain-containing protein